MAKTATKEAERICHTRVHMLITTKDRRRVFNDKTAKTVFEQAARDVAEREDSRIIEIGYGIHDPNGELKYPYGVVHIIAETQGGTAPSELIEKIRKAGWDALREAIPGLSKCSNLTRDYYIADTQMYDPNKAFEFVTRRSWREKRKARPEGYSI